MLRKKLLPHLLFALLVVGCEEVRENNYVESNDLNKAYHLKESDPQKNKVLDIEHGIMVRVINNRSDPTKIIIGSTNYGIIVPRDTSEYTSVELGNNDIYLNDEYFRQFEFMINESNPNPITRGILYYTFTFRESGYAYRMDTRVRN